MTNDLSALRARMLKQGLAEADVANKWYDFLLPLIGGGDGDDGDDCAQSCSPGCSPGCVTCDSGCSSGGSNG